MAPQSQLEESANDRGEAGGGGSEISRLRCSLSSQTPVLEQFFLEIAFTIPSDRLKNGPTKKKDRHQTSDRQTSDRIWPIWRSAGTRFQALETQIPLANSLKTVP